MASTVLALWLDSLIKAEEVVAWADRQILRTDAVVPSWLIDLSLRGPVACAKDPTVQLPSPIELTFLDRFAVRALLIDSTNTGEIERFVSWAARAAMGEDLDLPEVQLSYQFDHYVGDRGRMDLAVEEARRELPALRDALKERAESLLASTD